MRIQRLDICGFKSFKDRTVFTFGDGITGVVGPNGCGKSNVVDAIRWVMGEQSAKHLRGRAMEDVIFNGSERHAPLAMAEVSITFLNDRDDVPSQYRDVHEITVTRRLFRSGESEYLINRMQVRLLDVVELFLGTGVGTKAYSIIEQGRIGLIVSAKPEDRRSLIEEAAGITKYKARRKAAERKMEYTEQNLLRVGDILAELSRRLDALDRQARKAEKYRALKAQMRTIELHLSSLRWLELQALRKAAAERLALRHAEQAEVVDLLESSEAEIESARVALTEEALQLEQRGEEVAALAHGAALNQTNLEFYGRERDGVLRRRGELEEEIQVLAARVVALDEEAGRARDEVGKLAGRGGEDDGLREEMESALEALRADEQEAAARLEADRAGAMDLLSQSASTKGDLITIDRRRGDLLDRIARLQGEIDGLEDEAQRLERERGALAGRAGESRQLKLQLETRRGEESEARERVQRELFEAEAELIGLREELADKRSRLHSLVEIQRSYDGCDRGVRAVMGRAAGADRPEGVLGLVSELITSSAEHERALEAVLGERLQAIVVDGHERALELSRYLAEATEGRSTFLPVGLRAAEPLPAPDHPGLVARAVDAVATDHPAVVNALLGDVAIVRRIDDALELWTGGAPHTLVTLAGEVLAPSGALTGGEADGAGAGLLHKRREVAELHEVVRGLEARVAVASERHKRLARSADDLEQSLKQIERTGHAEELNLVTAEKDLGRITEQLARARVRAEGLGREKEELGGQLLLLDDEAERVRGAAAQAEAERARREESIAQLSAELSAIRDQVGTREADLKRLQIQQAADQERREGIDRTLQRVAGEKTEIDERRARAEAALAECAARLSELDARLEEAGRNVTSMADELARTREALAAARAEHATRAAGVAEREHELRVLRKRHDELVEAASSASLEERELAMQLSHLESGIEERHHVHLAEEVTAWHLLPTPASGSEEQLARLREQVERMGEVNLTAAEEYAELQGRHEFLSAQKEDLTRSLATLRQAIARINKTSRERFEETFHVVDSRFRQVFPRLFGGGSAHLVLVQEPGQDLMDAGVEIVAQPPGKKMQNVNLMSGGEKALTAVSLIFAIFLIKPTPFCLLDEVDAPLDDANVGRYNDMVREMSQTSQFILITHNKNTMEIGDTLYGITMEEPGVSKTVSVRLSRDGEERREAAGA